MSNDYKDPSFKKWLDKLQQESWQLELIISGFAIYGLIQAYEPTQVEMNRAFYNQEFFNMIIYGSAFIACSVLLINLIFHVLLRGIWIGALGLRYVSGDIDFDKLNYQPRFDRFLRNRIKSFDRFIAKLELYCSVIFGICFLIIFYFIGIVMILLALVGTATVIISPAADGSFMQWLGIILVLFILLGSLVLLLDFLTLGWFKKKKYLALVYYPIYRIFSVLMLSFLYRPMVYNFLDDRFGKRLLWALVPIYAAIIFMATLDNRESNFINTERVSGPSFADQRNYESMLTDRTVFARIATIPSKVVTDPFLKVFVVHTENLENYLIRWNEGLEPDEDLRGLTSGINLTGRTLNPFLSVKKRDSLRREFVNTFNMTYRMRIDSVLFPAQFVATTNQRKKLGFEGYIDLDSIAEGKHVLYIERPQIRKGDTVYSRRVSIPFWYYND